MDGGGISDELALARRLAAARKKAGLTQQQLCDKAGLAYSTLAKIERGAIKSPSIFTISAVAKACEISLDELIGSGKKADNTPAGSGISFVYFDVNGCLVHFYQRAFTQLAHDSGLPLDRVETAFWHYNDAVCSGEMPMEEFDAKFAERLGLTNLDWASYYLDAIEPVTGVNKLVNWVKDRAKVGLLTNLMPGIYESLSVRGKLPPARYDAIIDSSKVGAIKPEAKIYEVAQAKAGVRPNEILFIDDSRVNLTAAEHLGWRVLWFDDYHAAESIERVKAALQPAKG